MTLTSFSQKSKRQRFLMAFLCLVSVIALIYFIWWFLFARHFETTEDAYTNANITQINSQIEGNIVQLYADSTQYVSAGTLLLEIDATDAQSRLEGAKAHLAQAVRTLVKDQKQNQILSANILKAEAHIDRLQIQTQQAWQDRQRRESLASSGSVSKEEVSSALKNHQSLQAELRAAQADLLALQEQLKVNQALTATRSIAEHPAVQSAIAELTQAFHQMQRTRIYAPVDGVIAKRTAQLGQRVEPTSPLFTIVPSSERWVDANFKETQIRSMSVGQPATVVVDMYGDSVKYHGQIVGVSPGSGGSFALIPPQNASGNWIKVVQRVPVRISIDPTQHADFPLATGLSATVTVDVSDKTGSLFPKVPSVTSASTTTSTMTPSRSETTELQQLIDHLIRINS